MYDFFLNFLLLCTVSCLGQEVRRAIPLSQDVFSSNVKTRLQGLPNLDDSFAITANCIAHDPNIQTAWDDFQKERYQPMQKWGQEVLPSRMPNPHLVRYFFGGPDLLSVMAFFPDASTYILCGMEPVGKIKSAEELSPQELALGITQVRAVTKTFFQYGYFITKEMETEMSAGPFQGVLPILLTFLVLSEHQILSIQMLPLGGVPGVRIRFQSRCEGLEQELFYVQGDLSNKGSPLFFKWLSSFGQGVAYLKAASYLLHENEFSRTREFLLRESNAILQDDSGIPLRFFDQHTSLNIHHEIEPKGSFPQKERENSLGEGSRVQSSEEGSSEAELAKRSQWSFYFFGHYQGPIELFKKYYQSDLAAAYTTSGLRGPMFFGTGYHFNIGESEGANLLLCVKKKFVPRAIEVK